MPHKRSPSRRDDRDLLRTRRFRALAKRHGDGAHGYTEHLTTNTSAPLGTRHWRALHKNLGGRRLASGKARSLPSIGPQPTGEHTWPERTITGKSTVHSAPRTPHNARCACAVCHNDHLERGIRFH